VPAESPKVKETALDYLESRNVSFNL
jgi:hypothetical protein